MVTKRNEQETLFSKEQLQQWHEKYDPNLVEALTRHFDIHTMENASELLMHEFINGTAFNRSFLNATLNRRQSEAQMVQAEVRMFNATADLLEQSTVMRSQLGNSLTSESSMEAMATINETIGSLADLIGSLAKKNGTMGEGVPGGGGTTTGPGETAMPENPGGGTTSTPSCYEKYKKRIEELWDQKEQMGDSWMWGLQWASALKDLTICAGPEAVKLILEMLAAAKGK